MLRVQQRRHFLHRQVTTGTGTATFSADVAAFNGHDGTNGHGGLFILIVDGVTEGSFNIGSLNSGATRRDNLSATFAVTAGTHDVGIEVERRFSPSSGTDQYVDNVVFNSVAAPEPASMALFGVGAAAPGMVRRRKDA